MLSCLRLLVNPGLILNLNLHANSIWSFVCLVCVEGAWSSIASLSAGRLNPIKHRL